MTAYRNNPVVLFAHDSSSPPIGRTTRVWTDGTRLLGDAEFAPAETYAVADTIYRLVTGGFLKSGSVGFLPVDYKFSDRPAGGMTTDARSFWNSASFLCPPTAMPWCRRRPRASCPAATFAVCAVALMMI
jgi:hypothetical protein